MNRAAHETLIQFKNHQYILSDSIQIPFNFTLKGRHVNNLNKDIKPYPPMHCCSDILDIDL